ncbi:MAG: hypothetical protein OXK82_02680 [Deltaproteobacteria bacterium]|nr:hypothetical protein [Deltaproteobacteria bacterium]
MPDQLAATGSEGAQAVLTFRAMVKSNLFDQAWAALMRAQSKPVNDNVNSTQVLQIVA